VDSQIFALTIVRDFFRKYTKFDPQKINEFAYNFENLEIDSRLEIAFQGKPKGFEAPSYKVFTNETSSGTVIFDVETRVIERFITPGLDYLDIEIERMDYLPSYINKPLSAVNNQANLIRDTVRPSGTQAVPGSNAKKGQRRYSTKQWTSGFERTQPLNSRSEPPVYEVPRHIAWEIPEYINLH
jgi:hypothetical protein